MIGFVNRSHNEVSSSSVLSTKEERVRNEKKGGNKVVETYKQEYLPAIEATRASRV